MSTPIFDLRALRAPFGLLQTLRNSVDLLPRETEPQRRAVADRIAAVPWMLEGWRESLRAGTDRGLLASRRQAVEAAPTGAGCRSGTTRRSRSCTGCTSTSPSRCVGSTW